MKKIIALAVAAAVAAPAMADLTIGASARYQIDNGTYTAANDGTAAATAATAAAALDPAGPSTTYTANPQPAANLDTRAATNRVLVSFSGSTTAESGLFVSTAATLQLAGAAATTDGDNAITIGNEAANVVLGYFEPAGAFNSGADQFQQSVLFNSGNTPEGANRAREASNIGLNITAVENLTLQISTDVTSQEEYRVVAGYDFGAFAASVGITSLDAADNQTSVTVGGDLGGVAVNASYGTIGDNKSTNVNASYMGFGIALQKDEVAGGASEQEIYGSYSVANAGGVEGFTVTVGAGSTDWNAAAGVASPDTRYGVRLDYAF